MSQSQMTLLDHKLDDRGNLVVSVKIERGDFSNTIGYTIPRSAVEQMTIEAIMTRAAKDLDDQFGIWINAKHASQALDSFVQKPIDLPPQKAAK